MQAFKEKDVVVLTDLGSLDPSQFSLGDLGEVYSVNGDGTYTVEIYSMWSPKNKIAVCQESQLSIAILQGKLNLPHQLEFELGNLEDANSNTVADSRDVSSEGDRLMNFFSPRKHYPEKNKTLIEKGLCPICQAPLKFSHFTYVCSTHGEP